MTQIVSKRGGRLWKTIKRRARKRPVGFKRYRLYADGLYRAVWKKCSGPPRADSLDRIQNENGIEGRSGQVTRHLLLSFSRKIWEAIDVRLSQYEAIFNNLKSRSRDYPNYIFALTMGTGKTILMAACIFYEFLLANKWRKEVSCCRNALVFAPDKTVLQSLKEIQTFDIAKVVPPEYVNFITSNIKFHFLDDTSVGLGTMDGSQFNIVISNTQKIILKKRKAQPNVAEQLFSTKVDRVDRLGSLTPRSRRSVGQDRRGQRQCAASIRRSSG